MSTSLLNRPFGDLPFGDRQNHMPYDDPKRNQIPASSFIQTLAVNVDNEELSDAQFREFVRNTLPIVEVL